MSSSILDEIRQLLQFLSQAVPEGHEIKVYDRMGLILELFQQRAQSRESKLQVELASLQYAKSHLIGAHAEEFSKQQQRGGFGFLAGAGEKQIEKDKRLIDDKIAKIRKELRQHENTQSLHRDQRAKNRIPVISVVGYTNAGKSALVNKLTRSRLESVDKLFASLEPHRRGTVLPSGIRVIFSDTVGFVSELPHSLVAAFKSTLSEITESDLILHVRDIHNVESHRQKEDVVRVLEELNVDQSRMDSMLEVWNKIDLVAGEEVEATLKDCSVEQQEHIRQIRKIMRELFGMPVQELPVPLTSTTLAPVPPSSKPKPLQPRFNRLAASLQEGNKVVMISALKGTNMNNLIREIDTILLKRYDGKVYTIILDPQEQQDQWSFLQRHGRILRVRGAEEQLQEMLANGDKTEDEVLTALDSPSAQFINVDTLLTQSAYQAYRAAHTPVAVEKVIPCADIDLSRYYGLYKSKE